MLDHLNQAIRDNDADALQDAIYGLGLIRDENGLIPDDITFGIIDTLKVPGMFKSPLAGHLLNHFEYHSGGLSAKAKDRCIGFLNAWGDSFSHFHSQQVVAELREGRYLA